MNIKNQYTPSKVIPLSVKQSITAMIMHQHNMVANITPELNRLVLGYYAWMDRQIPKEHQATYSGVEMLIGCNLIHVDLKMLHPNGQEIDILVSLLNQGQQGILAGFEFIDPDVGLPGGTHVIIKAPLSWLYFEEVAHAALTYSSEFH